MFCPLREAKKKVSAHGWITLDKLIALNLKSLKSLKWTIYSDIILDIEA